MPASMVASTPKVEASRAMVRSFAMVSSIWVLKVVRSCTMSLLSMLAMAARMLAAAASGGCQVRT